MFWQGFRPSCRTSLILTRSTSACVLIPTSIEIAWDSGETMSCVVIALMTLKDLEVVGSTVGS